MSCYFIPGYSRILKFYPTISSLLLQCSLCFQIITLFSNFRISIMQFFNYVMRKGKLCKVRHNWKVTLAYKLPSKLVLPLNIYVTVHVVYWDRVLSVAIRFWVVQTVQVEWGNFMFWFNFTLGVFLCCLIISLWIWVQIKLVLFVQNSVL